MAVIIVAAAAIGIAIALSIPWFPAQASKQAHEVDTLYTVLLIVSVSIFVLVQTVVLFSVWKFRMRPGEEARDGPPIHGNTRLEVIWTALPTLLITGLCTYAFLVLNQNEERHASELDVNVVGQQFAWQFSYPMPGGRKIVSDQLYLPYHRPVHFHVKGLDVIHEFWVPAFRLGIDAVPGITTTLRATPSRLGTYPVVCAELCGVGHSTMRAAVHVVTPQRFQAWLTSHSGPSGSVPAFRPTRIARAKRRRRVVSASSHSPPCVACGPTGSSAAQRGSRLVLDRLAGGP
jgi:cytochrome c oxidase subunit 2